MSEASCAACGGGPLHVHLRVAGRAGEQGLVPTTDAFGTALADIARCPACGHMQVDPMPDRAVLGEAYATAESQDYVEEEQGQRATARALLERIERYAERGSLLDLGCWVGFLLSEAEGRGWRPTGVEPSEFASSYAREQLGLNVITAELLEADLAPSTFSAAFMGDVIEHLPEPGLALSRIGELLAPGGVLAMTLPDAGSRLARGLGRRWWSVIPTHVHYFTRRSIVTLLERHGWELLELRTAPKSFSVGYYLGRAGGYSERLGRALTGAARSLGLAERQWAPDFRDRMLVIARPVPREA